MLLRSGIAAVLVTAVVTLCVPGLAAQRPPSSGSPPASPERAAWLTDAEGRQYRLEPIPRAQATKIADDRIRTLWGVQADLVKEDERFFYIKLYRTEAAPKAAAAAPVPRAAVERLPASSGRVRWAPMAEGLPASGQWRDSVVLVDLSGDGRPEIVLGSARKTLQPPRAFARRGGVWAAAPSAAFPPLAYDYGGLTAGDFDGDGVPDLVLGVHLRGLLALRGGRTGAFADASDGLPFVSASTPAVFSSRAVILADCNGDRRPEIVALGEGPRLGGGAPGEAAVALGVATFTRDASGRWQRAAAPAPAHFGAGLAAGDVDGDGRIDLVIASGRLDDRRLVLLGDGACGWRPEEVTAARSRSYVTAVAAADFDGDRRAEIVAAYTDFSTDSPWRGVDVLARGADGAWTRTALLREAGRSRIEALAVGDVDAAGGLDLVAVGEGGAALTFLGDGRGGFTRERATAASPFGCDASAAAIADLDGDGRGDLVVAYAQESSALPGVARTCPSEGGVAAWRSLRR